MALVTSSWSNRSPGFSSILTTTSALEIDSSMDRATEFSWLRTPTRMAEMKPTLMATASSVATKRPGCSRISLMASRSITPPVGRD